MSMPSIVISHGASGTAASMRPHVDGLQARGHAARAIDLPKRRAELAVPVFAAAVKSEGGVVIGGQSYGGRVASLLAAERAVSGLVLFSYPLHAPGRVDDWERRVSHWQRIACPVLLLSGESDPLARLDLLREAVPRLPRAELVTYAGLGHTLSAVLDAVLDRVDRFVRTLEVPAD